MRALTLEVTRRHAVRIEAENGGLLAVELTEMLCLSGLRRTQMTDYKSMFEQAVRTLAAIDDALGVGDDGCGDPDQTLTAIAELKKQASAPLQTPFDTCPTCEALARTVMMDQTSHDKKYSECPNCFDGKSDLDHTCRKCGGTGKEA